MYKGEYFKGHPIIRNFWGVFFDFPFKMKKKFLGEFLYQWDWAIKSRTSHGIGFYSFTRLTNKCSLSEIDGNKKSKEEGDRINEAHIQEIVLNLPVSSNLFTSQKQLFTKLRL